MYLHEAIERGSKGHTVDREWWYSINDEGFMIIGQRGDSDPSTVFPQSILTASDWEVVQEEIEVGDMVSKAKCGSCANKCEVINKSGSDLFALQFTANCCGCTVYSHSDLILIRKGPKVHTFKGVRVHKETDGLKIHSADGRDTFERLYGNGKTYTLTLEED